MTHLLLWAGFSLAILVLLAIEFAREERSPHEVSLREAALWSSLWISLSLIFNLFLWRAYGSGPAVEFFTGYLIEKSLSLDNLFVILLLFRYFAVETRYQKRVLLWGVLGALLLRAAMIAAGAALIQRFEWMLEVFGGFLLIAGFHMLLQKSHGPHPERNPALRLARRLLPVTSEYHGEHFFVREAGAWMATPLLLVLIAVEGADLIFALDSIPAIFGITRDPFIVFSSNACALLGLRSLYFLLAGLLPRLRYLVTGLACVLMFIGGKMLVARWLAISTPVSLAVVAGLLAITLAASLLKPLRRE
jgi:tellurite resistance protein TerC